MSENWLEKLSEGGLPQILLGPAGAAISRLVGAGVEIPSAVLDGYSQKLKDKNAARSLVSKVIAERAAEMAAQDPSIIERAISNLLAKEHRLQVNKDEVAKVAIESLIAEPAPEDSPGPSEQFMAVFERYAEDAVDEDLRMMFGRLLAGEIRAPNSVSPVTLHFFSVLDQDTTKLIYRVLPCCLNDVAIISNMTISVADITYLEQAGFWSALRRLPFTFNENGHVIKTRGPNQGFVAMGKPGEKVELSGTILSRAGRDLLAAIESTFDYQKMANNFFNRGAEKFFSGRASFSGGRVSVSFDQEYKKLP